MRAMEQIYGTRSPARCSCGSGALTMTDVCYSCRCEWHPRHPSSCWERATSTNGYCAHHEARAHTVNEEESWRRLLDDFHGLESMVVELAAATIAPHLRALAILDEAFEALELIGEAAGNGRLYDATYRHSQISLCSDVRWTVGRFPVDTWTSSFRSVDEVKESLSWAHDRTTRDVAKGNGFVAEPPSFADQVNAVGVPDKIRAALIYIGVIDE